MAQLAIAGLGAIAGDALITGTVMGMSGASLGYMAGSIVGSLLFPPKQPDGPRLTELGAVGGSYGNPIPRVYGTYRVTGDLLCATDLREQANEQGGKGGSSYTTYSYSASFAFRLCETWDTGPIAGVRRIWSETGELLYDASASNTGITRNTSVFGGFAALVPTPDPAALSLGGAITVYTGTSTQLPDPTLQAELGAVPAYRGQAYVVFSNVPLEKSFNRIPTGWTFEVVAAGSYQAPPVQDVGTSGSPGSVAVDPLTGYVWTVAGGSSASTAYVNDPFTGTLIAAVDLGYPYASGIVYVPDARAFLIGRSAVASTSYIDGAVVSADALAVATTVNASGGSFTRALGSVFWPSGGLTGYMGVVGSNSTVYMVNAAGVSTGTVAGTTGSYTVDWADMPSLTLCARLCCSGSAPSDVEVIDPINNAVTAKISFAVATSDMAFDSKRNVLLAVGGSTAVTVDPVALTATSSTITGAGTLVDVIYHASLDAYIIHHQTPANTVSVVDAGTLTIRSSVAVPASLQELAVIPDNPEWVYGTGADGNLYRIPLTTRLTPAQVPLSNVVSSECAIAGLQASDLDVTALASTGVDGYYISQVSTARGTIEPLMMGYQFDSVESGGKLKFVVRGAESPIVVPSSALAAHDWGAAVPEPLALARADEAELPQAVSISYRNLGADHQVNTQTAQRLTGRARSTQVVELPLVLSDAHAKAIAEASLYSAWVARVTASVSVTRAWEHLEPTDVLAIDGNRLRVLKATRKGAVIDMDCAFDSGAVVVQGAIAGTAATVAQTIAQPSATALDLLDVPLLRDQDNAAGFYVAASGYPGRDWPGAVLYKSDDGGASWVESAAITATATAGATTTALPAWAGGNTIDQDSTVTVRLRYGTLSSITHLALLNGGNAAIIGGELLHFRNAALNGDGTYTLSGLLRGRKGTSVSGQTAGARFVLLNAATLSRVALSTSEIGLARQYKAVTIGQSIESARVLTLAGGGECLETLAPVYLGAGRDASGNVTIKWVRSARIGAGWRDYVDAPLGEASEAYEVEIWTAGFGALKRTITASTPSASYTAAQQTTDFGSAQASVAVRVYQLSAVVGRGGALQGTV